MLSTDMIMSRSGSFNLNATLLVASPCSVCDLQVSLRLE
jgi:hypothetical protein